MLRDVAELVRGVGYKPPDLRPAQSTNSVALLRATNIQDNALLVGDVIYVDKARVSATQMLRRWDVVVAMSSGSKLAVGKLAQLKADWTGSFGAFCGVLRPDLGQTDPEYFGFLLRSRRFRERIELYAQGTNIKNLARDHLLGFEFLLPPLEEQQRIAGILTTIQDARDANDLTTQALERLLTATICELLPGEP